MSRFEKDFAEPLPFGDTCDGCFAFSHEQFPDRAEALAFFQDWYRCYSRNEEFIAANSCLHEDAVRYRMVSEEELSDCDWLETGDRAWFLCRPGRGSKKVWVYQFPVV